MQLIGPPARAWMTGALNLGAGVDTKILLDTVNFDPGGEDDTSHFFGGTSAQLVTNGNHYICPSAGWYLVTAVVYATATAANQTLRAIIKNGTTTIASGAQPTSSAALLFASSVTDILECALNDVINLYAESNAALAVLAATNSAYMAVQQVG